MILPPRNWIYDIETYPNCFTFTIVREDNRHRRVFEISDRKNEFDGLYKCIQYLVDKECNMVGFNNLGFDYPVVHKLLKIETAGNMPGHRLAKLIYGFVMEQIASSKASGFPTIVKESEVIEPQIDLYKIWHFDNKAKSTSLKLLEFNMRSKTIEDLPFPVGTVLTSEQIDKLISYNWHDVKETLQFYNFSITQIKFREELSERYGRNFMNHNDTKIGKDYFVMRLEEAGIKPYTYVNNRREWKQTPRPHIDIKDHLFKYYDFERPETKAVFEWFSKQRIRETKGVFTEIPEHELGELAKYATMRSIERKLSVPRLETPTALQLENFKLEYPMGWIETRPLAQYFQKKQLMSYWRVWRIADTLNVVMDGFQFDFGTGGIHGSITDKVVRRTAKYDIIDADVSSMYPNLAIANRVYPLHLTDRFCDIYLDVYNQRKSFKKGTPENAMLKLALNGVYGDSNNKFGPFYDPGYTMAITINGQLSLLLLAEKLLKIEGLKIVQVNTDGITVACPKELRWKYDRICADWQKQVGLELEFADYEKMYIRDVNNYIAIYTNGKVKRKGVYQYEDLEWHKNQGGLVIQKAAEAVMLYGKDIEEFVRNHTDIYDFMLRTKIPKNYRLVMRYTAKNDDGTVETTDFLQQNVCRYYVKNYGGSLMKLMPPLKKKVELGEGEDRENFIEKGFATKVCNNMDDFDGEINYDYYIREAKKLIVPKIEGLDTDSDQEQNDESDDNE